ncbi:MAG TPA: prepilin-type N-terminal cleavage/methylation domain-containing protein [Pyrinomonadaceae bacterium]|jgi:prepilin-type N-terminal cleavage/methylation domain-containing protein
MKKLNSRKNESGFSLIELLVSMVIFLIVTGAIYGLLQVGRLDRNRASRRSDALKNARAALHLVGRDALNSGLGYTRFGAAVPDNFLNGKLGFTTDTDTERDKLTSVIPGNQINSSTLQTDKTDMIGFVYRDVDFFRGSPIFLNNATLASATGNFVTVTTVQDISRAGNPAVASVLPTIPNIHDLYLVEGSGTRAIVMATDIPTNKSIKFAPSDPLTINQALNGSTTETVSLLRRCTSVITTNCMVYPNVTLKRIFVVVYKVKSDGTLVRILYGNNTGANASNQIQEQPIAYGIKDLQIRYTTYTGISSDDPTVVGTNINVERRNDIRQVTISLTAQEGIDEATGKPIYVTLDGTFSTRNLEYDAG